MLSININQLSFDLVLHRISWFSYHENACGFSMDRKVEKTYFFKFAPKNVDVTVMISKINS